VLHGVGVRVPSPAHYKSIKPQYLLGFLHFENGAMQLPYNNFIKTLRASEVTGL